MFTGLIASVCQVSSVRQSGGAMHLTVDLGALAEGVQTGESIAINGVCLTVTDLKGTKADFDISESNLPVGQKFSIGNIILKITDVPHTGCESFAERFGKEALDFINAPERKSMRLRGVYAQILNPGMIHVGDFIKKM